MTLQTCGCSITPAGLGGDAEVLFALLDLKTKRRLLASFGEDGKIQMSDAKGKVIWEVPKEASGPNR